MVLKVTVTDGVRVNGGELSSLDSSQFDLSAIRYPENVGSTDVPHFVLFHIYVPDGDQYAIDKFGTDSDAQSNSQKNIDFMKGKRPTSGGASNVGIKTAAAIEGFQTFLGSDGGLGESTIEGAGAFVKSDVVTGPLVSGVSQQISFRPKIKRIQKSIAIYMPDTVMSSTNHGYNELSATEALGDLGLASVLGSSIQNQFAGSGISGVIAGLKNLYKQQPSGASPALLEVEGSLSQASGLVGSGFTDLALKSSGTAINPQVELIYKGTQNRSFIFEFKFQPRSTKDTAAITDIIKTFKMFAAPSIQAGSRGRYFIVPAQFDITFKFMDQDNQYISRISTCVLESIDVNYAGQGQFATMVDGMPADINMQLRFKESDIIYRELIEQYNY